MSGLGGRGRLLVFALLVLLQAVAVVGLVVREENLRANGREILLKAAPVDPRDLLRGDYVILRYEVQDVPLYSRDYSGSPSEPAPGNEVYVTLRHDGRYWTPASYWQVSSDSLPPEPGVVFLRGTVTNVSRTTAMLRVSYPNLERYYVPEGTGNLPKPPDVAVLVDASGNARIQRVEIDGKPWPTPTPAR